MSENWFEEYSEQESFVVLYETNNKQLAEPQNNGFLKQMRSWLQTIKNKTETNKISVANIHENKTIFVCALISSLLPLLLFRAPWSSILVAFQSLLSLVVITCDLSTTRKLVILVTNCLCFLILRITRQS